MNTPDITSALCPWPWLVALVAASSCLIGGCAWVEERIGIADVPQENVSKAGDPSLPVICNGDHTVVRSGWPHKLAAVRCVHVIEEALPVLEAHLACRLPPGEKLVVNLYGTQNEYETAIEELDLGSLLEKGACTSSRTRETYIVIQPRAETAYLELVGGLPQVTEYLVCHEIVHQFVSRANMPNDWLWPVWYEEGMAEVLAEQCMKKEGETATPLVFDSRSASARNLWQKQGGAVDLAPLLGNAPPGPGMTGNEYCGAQYCLYRYLASDVERFRELANAIAELEAPPRPSGPQECEDLRSMFAGRCVAELVRVYGPLERVAAALGTELDNHRPAWCEQVASVQRLGDGILCTALPEGNAILIIESAPAGPGFVLEGELSFPGIGDKKQADIYVGYDEPNGRLLKTAVGMDARGRGCATLLVYSDDQWREDLRVNHFVPDTLVAEKTWIEFRLEVSKEMISLTLAKEPIAKFQVPAGFETSLGRWGVGSHECVVRFRNLKAR